MAKSGQKRIAEAAALVGATYERARNVVRVLQPAGLIPRPGRGSRDPMLGLPNYSNLILGLELGIPAQAAETVTRVRGLVPVGVTHIVTVHRATKSVPGTSDHLITTRTRISVYGPGEPIAAFESVAGRPIESFSGKPFGEAFDGATEMFVTTVEPEARQMLREAIEVTVRIKPLLGATIVFTFPSQRFTLTYAMAGDAASDEPRPTYLQRVFSGEVFEGLAALVQPQTKEAARAPTPTTSSTNGRTAKPLTHPLQGEFARKRAEAQASALSFGRFSPKGEPTCERQKSHSTA